MYDIANINELTTRFRTKDNNYLIAITNHLLATGVDIKEIDCIVINRSVKSSALLYQMLSRGLRPSENKPYLKVINFTGSPDLFSDIDLFQINYAQQ